MIIMPSVCAALNMLLLVHRMQDELFCPKSGIRSSGNYASLESTLSVYERDELFIPHAINTFARSTKRLSSHGKR